jgi:hypothetical protein
VAEVILAQARGQYQRDLLNGHETWSGSSLKGKASSYGARYAESRQNLLARINDALPDWYDADTKLVYGGTPKRWRRELVIEGPDGTHIW